MEKQATTLAAILEQGFVSAFQSQHSDGRSFVQVLCSDGSELVLESDNTGAVTIRHVSDTATDGLEFDQVLVDAGLAP